MKFSLVLLGLALLVSPVRLDAQPAAERWRTVTAEDTATLRRLRWELRYADHAGFRAVLETAADRGRPFLVRIHALEALGAYLNPRSPISRLDSIAADTLPACRTVVEIGPLSGVGIVKEDTASRPCRAGPRRVVQRWVDHPNYTRSSSIEPALRDSIRVLLHALASSDPDRRIARAASHVAAIGGRVDPAGRDAAAVRLVASWGAADDSAAVALLGATQGLRDRRIQDALEAVVRDEARPVPVRLTALDALATLAHPVMYTLRVRDWSAPAQGCSTWGWWGGHDAVQEEGAEPMGARGRVEVLRFLDAVSASAGDARVRTHAAKNAECVRTLRTRRPTPGL